MKKFSLTSLAVLLPSLGVPISDHYGVKVHLSNIRKNCNSVQERHYHCVSEIKEFISFQPNYSEVCFVIISIIILRK